MIEKLIRSVLPWYINRWSLVHISFRFAGPHGKSGTSVFFQVCWAIWKARNECVFNGVLHNSKRTIDIAKSA